MEGVRIIVSSPVCTVQAARTNGVTPFFFCVGDTLRTVQYSTVHDLCRTSSSSSFIRCFGQFASPCYVSALRGEIT
jgi:hypothetical protein